MRIQVQALQQVTGTAPRRYCFVFVCQAGELEIKALLLAASLKRFLRCSYELVAAVPTPASVWGELPASTVELLRSLGVRIEAIVNPVDPDYPIGNKLACLGIATTAEKIVFLDSDILCLREFHDEPCLASAFAAKPADLRTFSASAEDWRPMYAAARVNMPTLRLPTTVSNEFGLAYFNSGVIFADTRADLGAAWIECARAIDAEPALRPHRHWLDQISLAIAVHQRGLGYASLDEAWNFPAHLKPLRAPLPVFCHYHWPRVLRSEPVLRAVVGELLREYPPIAQKLAVDAQWAALLEPRTRRSFFPRRMRVRQELIISGIPGSGDDHLGDVLAGFNRCVVLRDPVAVAAPLTQASPPWQMAAFMRDVRSDLLSGRPLPAGHGQVAGSDDGPNAGRLHADDFVLALKSPMPLLLRLDALKRVLPDARFVACVDNPLDTIAAWKCGDAMLRDADVGQLPCGLAGAAWLSKSEAAALQEVSSCADPAERRAMLWWWLAQRLLSHAQGVVLIRYAELRAEPRGGLRGILRGLHAGRRRTPWPDPPTRSRQLLDDRDRQAIRAICSQAAADLGVRCE
ncbi:MAG: hypothetical protein P4L92_20265 [Rudaea sp.]|nr:hypothetical protein [Rudaea sp.]